MCIDGPAGRAGGLCPRRWRRGRRTRRLRRRRRQLPSGGFGGGGGYHSGGFGGGDFHSGGFEGGGFTARPAAIISGGFEGYHSGGFEGGTDTPPCRPTALRPGNLRQPRRALRHGRASTVNVSGSVATAQRSGRQERLQPLRRLRSRLVRRPPRTGTRTAGGPGWGWHRPRWFGLGAGAAGAACSRSTTISATTSPT